MSTPRTAVGADRTFRAVDDERAQLARDPRPRGEDDTEVESAGKKIFCLKRLEW
jgi:hypothetical protein